MNNKIIKIDNPPKVRQFINFPFDLYKNNQLWVPPFKSDMKNALKKKHPFFKHSDCEFFTASYENKVVGRISVMDNKRANEYRGTNTAFFGFFEAIDDEGVAGALFNAAFDWAEKRGLNRIIGPRGLIGSDTGGILVDGFEHRPALGVPYNLPCYDKLIKAAGFKKDTDHYSGYLPGNLIVPERIIRIAEKIKNRRGYWVKSFSSKDEMLEWIPKLQKTHRKAFDGSKNYYPPTDEEMQTIVNTIISAVDPGLVKLLMLNDELVGFSLAYQDISVGIKNAKGMIWPFGWYHILKERKQNDWLNLASVGILPKYQGMGGNTILYTEIDKTIKSFGFKHIDVIQVNETNYASFRDNETMGIKWYKRHRSYERKL